MGAAIDLTCKLYPGLLEKDTNLMFALKCRQFVEMVNGTDSDIYRDNVECQLSVIQSTKLLHKSNENSNLEDSNQNNSVKGLNAQHFINGQIEEDVEMEESNNSGLITRNNQTHSKHIPNSNGFKHLNADDIEMGML